MATTRPFAYNTGGPISGTTNFGSTLISGDIEVDYSEDYGGVKWWMGPDEDLGYVIGNSRPGGQPIPSGATGIAQLGFWRSKFKTNESFLELANYIGAKNGQPPFANTTDAENWLNSQGYFSSYDIPTPTPSPTSTVTPTPTETNIPVTPTNTETPTPTPTPSVTTTQTPTLTQTPTPSTSPIPVTGYGYNLLVLPYNPPASGNTIFPTFATPGLNIGTTNPNTFATNGVYWNSIDNLGVDRSTYYNGMTGVSVTAYFTQNGHTVIYSGSPTAFTYDGSPLAFNYNPNSRAGQLVLIQSASTNFITGQTVYISFVVNIEATPTPTPTMTQTPTNTETPTNTPTTTPTVTPTNPTLLQILNQTTGSRTVTSCTLDGVSQTLTSGSFPITAGNNGYGLTHGSSVLPNSIQFNFGGSGTFDLYSYKNGVLVNYLTSYNSSSYVAGGITLATSDQLVLIITDPGALATPTPTSTPTPTPSAAVLSGLTVNINQVGPNVVMSASGTLNINGLTLVGSNLGPQNGGGIGIGTATFIMGATPSNYDQYSGFTSTPSNFGTGGGAPPSSSSGDIFGCFYPGGPPHQLMVPVGYTTGSAVSSTQTFNSTTLVTLGLVTGTYTYSWGSGANAYSVNVVIS